MDEKEKANKISELIVHLDALVSAKIEKQKEIDRLFAEINKIVVQRRQLRGKSQ